MNLQGQGHTRYRDKDKPDVGTRTNQIQGQGQIRDKDSQTYLIGESISRRERCCLYVDGGRGGPALRVPGEDG